MQQVVLHFPSTMNIPILCVWIFFSPLCLTLLYWHCSSPPTLRIMLVSMMLHHNSLIGCSPSTGVEIWSPVSGIRHTCGDRGGWMPVTGFGLHDIIPQISKLEPFPELCLFLIAWTHFSCSDAGRKDKSWARGSLLPISRTRTWPESRSSWRICNVSLRITSLQMCYFYWAAMRRPFTRIASF